MSLDAQAEVTLTPEQRSVIQGQLVLLGFLNGEADGEFGPNTREAIKKFQQSNRHAAANYLTEEERRTLLSQSSQIPTNGPQRSPTIAPSLPSPADNSAKKIAEAEATKRAAEEDSQRKTAEAEAANRAADEAVTRRTAEAGAAKRSADEEAQRRTAEAERAKRASPTSASRADTINLACFGLRGEATLYLFIDTEAKHILLQASGAGITVKIDFQKVDIGPDVITGTEGHGWLEESAGPNGSWSVQVDRRTLVETLNLVAGGMPSYGNLNIPDGTIRSSVISQCSLLPTQRQF
jgi:peptidoglycan hydrolase-like protein with peptidoglycan-binding domain